MQYQAPVAAVAEKPAVEKRDENTVAITSPMVGTFYLTPNPESPAYVKVGEHVNVNHVVCIIEAMKIFNEIESEVSGVVERICVENGTPVEYGQELFIIRKA
jgi:acetyl-CoA carboxylase biotin carboxyl carrier protein